MHSVSQHNLVKSLTISTKRPCRPLPHGRCRQRSQSFHNSCHRRFPEAPQNGADSHGTVTGSDESRLNGKSTDTEPASAKTDEYDGATPQPESRPYGSAARRAFRNRRIQEPEYFTLPAWFLKNNISEYEGLGAAWPKSLQVIQKLGNSLLRRFPPQDDQPQWHEANVELPDPSTDGTLEERKGKFLADHFAADPTIELPKIERSGSVESLQGSSSSCVYSIDYFTFAELYGLYNGLLQPPHLVNASEPAAEKSHLILKTGGERGHYFLDATVRALASLSGATMITINAQDVAELASGPYSNFDRSFKHSTGMISYDVYKRKPQFYQSRFTFGDREEVETEEEDEHETPEPATDDIPSISVTAGLVDLSSKSGLSSLLQLTDRQLRKNQPWSGTESATSKSSASRLDPRWKTIIEAVFSTAVSQTPRDLQPNLETSSDPELSDDECGKLRRQVFLEEAGREYGPHTHSALNRIGVPGYQADVAQGKRSPKAMRNIIIQVQDFTALRENAQGIDFLDALFERVTHSRSQGDRVIIVGTATTPFSGALDRRVKSLPSPGVEDTDTFFHVREVPPAVSGTDQQAFRDAASQKISEVNMRHFMQVIRQRSDNISIWPFWVANLVNSYEILFRLRMKSEFLTFDEIHERAILFLGFFSLPETGNWVTNLDDLGHLAHASADIRRHVSRYRVHDRIIEKLKHPGVKDPSSPGSDGAMVEELTKSCNKYERKLLSGVVEPSKIQTTFEGVYAPYDTKDALRTLTMLSIKRPEAFSYGVLATNKIPGLLMYGPPGTGKTLLAKAVAKESGARVLEVSGAEIFDMYVGESEKNIRALFTLAKRLSPCVVFIDEADALFGSRSGLGGRQRTAHREVINQFLKEWDGMSNDAGSAFIMVATNRPYDLDDAVLRRLPRRILVDLPTERDRIEILKIHLREEIIGQDVDLSAIAKQTPFYSGSDLKNLCVAAALNCVKEENKQASEYEGTEPYKYPDKRVIAAMHFESALNEITASISEDMNSLRDIKKFDEQYGDKKKNRKGARSWGFRTPVGEEKRDTVKIRELA